MTVTVALKKVNTLSKKSIELDARSPEGSKFTSMSLGISQIKRQETFRTGLVLVDWKIF